MTRSKKKLLKEFNFNKEATISIREDPRTEFMCGVTAPARKKVRRGSVATERYVAAEISNDNDRMELDESLTNSENMIDSGNQIPEFPTQDYSARQRQNLSRFEEIPSISRDYTRFHNYHHQRERGNVQHVSQAANMRAPFHDEYLEGVPRIFEIAPQAAGLNAVQAPNFFDPIAERSLFDQVPQAARFDDASMRDLAVFEPIAGRSPFQRMRQATPFGNTSVRPSIDFDPIAERNLFDQMPQASMRSSAVFEPILGRNTFQQTLQAARFHNVSTAPFPIAERNVFEQIPQALRSGSAPMRAHSFAVSLPQMAELIPEVPREPHAGMGDQENRRNVPNLLNDAHGFLDYVKNAANQFENKKK